MLGKKRKITGRRPTTEILFSETSPRMTVDRNCPERPEIESVMELINRNGLRDRKKVAINFR